MSARKLSWKVSVHAAKKRKLLLSQPMRAFETVNGEASGDEPGLRASPEEERRNSHLSALASESEKQNSGSSALEASKRLQEEGNRLAEEGDYCGALKKWEKAIFLTPDRAVLHEQKAQILLEMNSVWNALQSATRAVELDPNWAEAHLTLARCQLNLGEPVFALNSFLRVQQMKTELDVSTELTQARHLVAMQQSLSRSLPNSSDPSSMASLSSSQPRRAFVIDGPQPQIPSLALPPSSAPASSPTPSASPPLPPSSPPGEAPQELLQATEGMSGARTGGTSGGVTGNSQSKEQKSLAVLQHPSAVTREHSAEASGPREESLQGSPILGKQSPKADSWTGTVG